MLAMPLNDEDVCTAAFLGIVLKIAIKYIFILRHFSGGLLEPLSYLLQTRVAQGNRYCIMDTIKSRVTVSLTTH